MNMLVKTFACALNGVDAITITIETSVTGTDPFYSTVGLADTAAKESLQRVQCAVHHSNFKFPLKRVIINLAPADIKKTGTGLELAMAVGILAASGQVANMKKFADYIIMGELGLDGSVQPIKGALPIAIQAKKEKFKGLIVPKENVREAAMVSQLPVYAINSLTETIDFLNDNLKLEPVTVDARKDFFEGQYNFDCDFADVKGQKYIKRSLEIAAAGGHNIILIGPPGAGKTMLAKRLPTILPPLTLQEALETTKIYSVAGKLPEYNNSLLNKRPFRSPHHTISNIALVGGGSSPQPGEISLAHNGVLFLDELPEYTRHVLEVMRQPMEDRKVLISRAMKAIEFPSNFILVASMNPCPCGYYTHPETDCNCSATSIQKYMAKISGPLMDRIDLHIEVQPVPLIQMNDQEPGEPSATIRERVILARQRQLLRFQQEEGCYNNAQMNSQQLKKYCGIDKNCEALLFSAMQRMQLSARAYDRILKVARTIADLAGIQEITIDHLSEAIQYRSLDKEFRQLNKKHIANDKLKIA